MSDLSDFIENLKRAVATPGTFADVFPSTTDDDLVGSLADGMAEAQLDGFLSTFDIDLEGFTTTPDLAPPQIALVLLYASSRILTVELMNRRTHTRYEAPGVVFEEDQGSQLLSEMLKAIRDRKKQLLEDARRGNYAWNGGEGFTMADLAFIKNVEHYGGSQYGYTDALGW